MPVDRPCAVDDQPILHKSGTRHESERRVEIASDSVPKSGSESASYPIKSSPLSQPTIRQVSRPQQIAGLFKFDGGPL